MAHFYIELPNSIVHIAKFLRTTLKKDFFLVPDSSLHTVPREGSNDPMKRLW